MPEIPQELSGIVIPLTFKTPTSSYRRRPVSRQSLSVTDCGYRLRISLNQQIYRFMYDYLYELTRYAFGFKCIIKLLLAGSSLWNFRRILNQVQHKNIRNPGYFKSFFWIPCQARNDDGEIFKYFLLVPFQMHNG